ncbi:hypothetical protein [Nonomuraea fuscirosea]|uniref:hypothetical protein n=1 Tax=Nonomuraea fuscirosea TaxID=1291556 RepID=UPI003436E955
MDLALIVERDGETTDQALAAVGHRTIRAYAGSAHHDLDQRLSILWSGSTCTPAGTLGAFRPPTGRC